MTLENATTLPQAGGIAPPAALPSDIARLFSSLDAQMQLHTAATSISNLIAKCDMIPEHFRGKPSNCYVAVRIAIQANLDPIMVMQCLAVIDHRPVWMAKWYGANLAKSKRWWDPHYDMTTFEEIEVEGLIYCRDKNTGQRYTQKVVERVTEMKCVYSMVDRETGKRQFGPPITMSMAVKEGWYSKNGSKWKTMPETMIGYRALTAWVKKFEPGLEFGIYSDDEIRDSQPVEVESVVVPDQASPACQACGKPSDSKFTTVLDGFVVHVCSAHCLAVRQAAYAQYLKQQHGADQADDVNFDSSSGDCLESESDLGPDADPDSDQNAETADIPPLPQSEPGPAPEPKKRSLDPDKLSENQISDWYDEQIKNLQENFDIEYSKAVAEGKDNHSALRAAMKAVM